MQSWLILSTLHHVLGSKAAVQMHKVVCWWKSGAILSMLQTQSHYDESPSGLIEYRTEEKIQISGEVKRPTLA